MLLGTRAIQHDETDRPSFNPQRGFMLLGTSQYVPAFLAKMFQSPERIHAFGNPLIGVFGSATGKFQSPERIHAFGNKEGVLVTCWHIRFNPQRGFMLLGTMIGIPYSVVLRFQSPERIHAFGNNAAS